MQIRQGTKICELRDAWLMLIFFSKSQPLMLIEVMILKSVLHNFE